MVRHRQNALTVEKHLTLGLAVPGRETAAPTVGPLPHGNCLRDILPVVVTGSSPSLETLRIRGECPRGRELRKLVNLRASLQALRTDFLPGGAEGGEGGLAGVERIIYCIIPVR